MRNVSLRPETFMDYIELKHISFPKGKKPSLRGHTLKESHIERPLIATGDPEYAVDYFVAPWLLYWFGGPELQPSNGTTDDEEADAIIKLKNAFVVSRERQGKASNIQD